MLLWCCFTAWSLLVLLVGIAAAEQVTLKNGDRLTGEIVGLSEEAVLLKSPILGELRIPWRDINSLEGKKPIRLITHSGRELTGTLEKFESDVWVIRPEDSEEPLRISFAELEQLDVQAPRAKLWKGKISAGLAHQSGNTDSFGFNFRGDLTRRTRSSRFALQGVYERKETQGTLDTDKGSLSGRYDYLFTDRLFAFGLVDLETDRAEGLDLRHTETVGPGYFFIRTDRTELSGEIGISSIQEFFRDGRRETNLAGLVGGAWEQKIFQSTLSLKAAYLPKFRNPETNFLANGQLIFSTPITDLLSLDFVVTDEYNNNPRPGVEKNDVSINTNLAVKY